ncbi:hypothetical protein BH20ACT5_BH20ACT5_25030 [soil metagenome]
MITHTDALAAAGAALGSVLTPVGQPLRGSDRAMVLRALVDSGPETVVVKCYYAATAGEGWVREVAALSLLRGRGAAPRRCWR